MCFAEKHLSEEEKEGWMEAQNAALPSFMSTKSDIYNYHGQAGR